MNFTNHYKQLSNDYLAMVSEYQIHHSANLLAGYGFVSLADLNDLGNMLLMGWEMNR